MEALFQAKQIMQHGPSKEDSGKEENSSGEHSRLDQTGFIQQFIGTVLDSQYKILELMGQNRSCLLFKAHYLMLDKSIAVKILPEFIGGERKNLLRFKQEAQSASAVDHPNIVKIYGFGITGGEYVRPYVVMDYVDGPDIIDFLRQSEKISPSLLLDIFIQCCSTMSYAHGKGLVHGDLKPENLKIVRKDGSPSFVKILDFGIGRLVQNQRVGAGVAEELSGGIYRSPEQAHGHPGDNRSDIYALGCILYETLVGKPVYARKGLQKRQLELPSEIVIDGVKPALLDRLNSIVFRTIKKNPDKRFQSMEDLENELRAIRKSLDEGVSEWSFACTADKCWRNALRFLFRVRHFILPAIVVGIILYSGSYFIWSNISWFFQKHEFVVPDVNWSDAAKAASGANSGGTKIAQQKLMDDPSADSALDAGAPPQKLLELWRKRAELSRQAGVLAEELEARWHVVDLLQKMGMVQGPVYADACLDTAECLVEKGTLFDSLPWIERAVKTPKQSRSAMFKNYSRLADVTLRLGRYEDARMQYILALQFYRSANSKEPVDLMNYAVCKASLGDICRYEHAWAESDHFYSDAMQAVEQFRAPESRVLLSKIPLYRGYVNQMLKRYPASEKFYAEAMPYANKELAGRPAMLQSVLNDYAYVLWQVGNPISAVQLRSRAKSLFVAKPADDTSQ